VNVLCQPKQLSRLS